eukprot:SAG31_NODE_1416_length_8441_cov_11.436706_9_plen_202_part_00
MGLSRYARPVGAAASAFGVLAPLVFRFLFDTHPSSLSPGTYLANACLLSALLGDFFFLFFFSSSHRASYCDRQMIFCRFIYWTNDLVDGNPAAKRRHEKHLVRLGLQHRYDNRRFHSDNMYAHRVCRRCVWHPNSPSLVGQRMSSHFYAGQIAWIGVINSAFAVSTAVGLVLSRSRHPRIAAAVKANSNMMTMYVGLDSDP